MNIVASFNKIGLYPALEETVYLSFINPELINAKLIEKCDQINFQNFFLEPENRRKTVALRTYVNNMKNIVRKERNMKIEGDEK